MICHNDDPPRKAGDNPPDHRQSDYRLFPIEGARRISGRNLCVLVMLAIIRPGSKLGNKIRIN